MARLHLHRCIVDIDNGYVEHESGRRETLTTMERRLLAYVNARPETDISHDDLLRDVWEYAPGVQTRAAYFTARRLKFKIEEDPKKPRHLLTAHGVGFRFVPLQNAAPNRKETPDARVLRHTNLCPDATTFFGRTRQIEELRELLTQDGTPLITLTGAGGTGKTRLASELGNGLSRRGREVWFCDLSEVTELAGLVRVAAQALSIPLGAEADIGVDRIGTAMAGREDAVVILDNFEQIAHLAPESLAIWMRLSPNTRFVATSQTALRIKGERVFVLDSLDIEDAVRLLRDRVEAAGRELPDDADETLAQISTALDGMPLALELAAARLVVLSPDQVLQLLSDRFKLLNRAQGGGLPRHETLRATIDWSWELLTAHEQSTLAQCAAFRGGFALEDAEAVVSLDGDAPWVMDVVQTLVERSLLKVAPVPELPGDLRYSTYASIQQYAWEKLQSDDDCDNILARHSTHILAEGERLGLGYRDLRARPLWQLRYLAENIEAALERTTDPERVCRLSLALMPVLNNDMPVEARLAVLDRAVAVSEHVAEPLRALVYLIRAGAVRATHRSRDGRADLERADDLSRDSSDADLRGRIGLAWGDQYLLRGALADAASWLEPAWDLTRGRHDSLEVQLLQSLLHCRYLSGEFERADAAARELQNLLRMEHLSHLPANNLASWFGYKHRFEEQMSALQHDLRFYRSMGMRQHAAFASISIATQLADVGDPSARQMLYDGVRQCREIGHELFESRARFHLGTVLIDCNEKALARRELELGLEIAERLGLLRHQILAHLGLGLLALSEDRDPTDHALRGGEVARTSGDEHITHMMNGLLAVAKCSAGEPFEDLLTAGRDFARRISNERVELWCLCWRGLAHLGLGDPEPAREAVSLARRAPDPWFDKNVGIRTLVREIERRM